MVKIKLKTPIWDTDGTLYRPGKEVEVPEALAKRLGLASPEEKKGRAKKGGQEKAENDEKDQKDEEKTDEDKKDEQ